jgi:hypothetical protein
MPVEQLIRYGVVSKVHEKELLGTKRPYKVAFSRGMIQSYDVTALFIDYCMKPGMTFEKIMKLGGGNLDPRRIKGALSLYRVSDFVMYKPLLDNPRAFRCLRNLVSEFVSENIDTTNDSILGVSQYDDCFDLNFLDGLKRLEVTSRVLEELT